MEAKLSELQRERENLKEGISAEEVTIAAVREELSAEQLQLDKERKQIEMRDSELKKEEVSQLTFTPPLPPPPSLDPSTLGQSTECL